MDLSRYGRKEILLTALKSEIESEKAYRYMANRVRNQMLSDRLMFLAREESKQAAYVKSLFPALGKEDYPEGGQKIEIRYYKVAWNIIDIMQYQTLLIQVPYFNSIQTARSSSVGLP